MRNNHGITAAVATMVGALPAGLLCLIGAFATVVPVPTAHAANNQCVWEGGLGKAGGHAYCEAEDCAGNGGLAQCSIARATAASPFTDPQVGPDSWAYHGDYDGPGHQAHNANYCQSAGGWWGPVVPGGFNVTCHDLPADILGGGGRITNSESRVFSIAKQFADTFFGPDCGAAVASDTGWHPGVPDDSLGIAIWRERYQTYNAIGGASCTSSIGMSFLKNRAAACRQGYTYRNAVTGPECVLRAECGATCAGNPVSVVTGTKFHRDDDYVPGADTGLSFSRYYKSSGYYYPDYLTGANSPGVTSARDYWRHTYDRRLLLATGSAQAQVLGIVQRPDGSLQIFDSAGNEKTNRMGALGNGAHLQAVAGGWDLTLASKDVEHYDSAGRLVTITTRTGRVTTLAYLGDQLTVTGPFGHVLTLGYTDDLLTSVTLPNSTSISYGYDDYARLASVTYADNTTREYFYDPNDKWLLTAIEDENNVVYATYTYDTTTGRVTSESHAGGVNQYTFSYGASGQPTTVTDPLGTATQYGLASAGGLYRPGSHSQACMGCGAFASTTYDSKGNLASRTDFNGHQTVYTFDAARNLETSRTEANGTPRARTITTQWHPTFRLPVEINEPGLRTNFTYDGAGNVLTQTLTDTTTNQSRTWTFTYTGLGQLSLVDGPRTDVNDIATFTYYSCTAGNSCGQLHTVTDAAGNLTTYGSYDAHGTPLSITDANGTLITLAQDDRQRLTSYTAAGETTTLEYWPTGLLKKVTQPDGSFFSYGYDAAHRLTSVTDTLGNSMTYTLNGAGQRLTEEVRDATNVLSFRRTRIYNSLGRVVEENGSAGQTTSFVYDADGNVIEVEDPTGRITSQAYDELNRVATLTDAALQFTGFAYDGQDNLLSVTDPRNLLTSYAYNGFGEQVSQTSPDTGTSNSLRDAAGNPDTATDARGKTGDYTYDALDRVTAIAYTDETVTLGYDAGTGGKGQLTSMTDGAGTTSWTYDALGRVAERSQTSGTVTLEVGYGYDAYGRPASLTTPSGQVLSYEYQDGRISGLKMNGTWVLNQVAYQPFGPTKGWSWGNGTSTSRTYDTDGQLTQLSSAGTSTFTYHLDGTIATRSDDFAVSIPSTEGTASFTVSPTSNRLQSATGLITRSFAYDAAGNTTGDGARSFTYNDSGRMKTSTHAGLTTTYSYNGLGERVKKTSTAATTYFAYDEAGHLLGEYDAAGDLIQETVWFGDIPVAVLEPLVGGGVTMLYIHTDHLNTPRRITRPNDNAILWRWDSDPFGATAANEDPDGDMITFAFNHRFPGQYFDGETGLHYNYFRDYDAVTGRYIQSDPIGLAGGTNTYAYVGANPVGFIDPTGLDASSLMCRAVLRTAGGLAGGAAGYGCGCVLGGAAGGVGGTLVAPGVGTVGGLVAGCGVAGTSGAAVGVVLGQAAGDQLADTICSDEDDKECTKASAFALAQAGILDPHRFKTEYGAVPNSRFDICACKDGSMVIKAVGGCGQPGPSIPTHARWK